SGNESPHIFTVLAITVLMLISIRDIGIHIIGSAAVAQCVPLQIIGADEPGSFQVLLSISGAFQFKIDHSSGSAASINARSRSFDDFGAVQIGNVQGFQTRCSVGFGQGDAIDVNLDIAYAPRRSDSVSANGHP